MFYDRKEAGILLASQLKKFKNQSNVIVLGLARGGVVVAYEIAKNLSLPLNAIVPKKLGAPMNPELAIGAIMENGEGIFNDRIIRMLSIPQEFIEKEINEKKAQAQMRAALYRQHAPLPEIKDHIVILVDDGVATGATLLAAIKAMRKDRASLVIAAVPVASTEALSLINKEADEVYCLKSSDYFEAVSRFYENFDQTEDEEVIQLLKDANTKKI
jgi:putative phosphoribosyl transferase